MLRLDTLKLLEENIGRTLFDINHSKIFFNPPPRVMEIKTKINKWDLMKLKSFFKAKETTKKMKRHPSEREKIFANESTDKGLISKIYKQLMQLNIKEKKPNQKMGRRGFPGGAVVENLPANAGDTGLSPGLGRSHMLWSN